MDTRRPLLPLTLLLTALVLLGGLPAGAQPAPQLEPVPSDAIPPPPTDPSTSPPPSAAPRRPARADAPIRRFYLKLRPFVGIARYNVTDQNTYPGGVLLDLGIEYNSANGLWVGLEAAPLAFTNLFYGIPFPSGRLALGYSGKYFGVAAGLGSSIGPYFNVGPIVRVGRLEGTHARFRIAFSVFPPLKFPVNGDLQLNIKLRPRLRLTLEAGGDFIIQGLYSNAGVQILFRGEGGPGTHILTVGAGVSGVFLVPGPMVTIGYERRW
jgi:hypothetical protein